MTHFAVARRMPGTIAFLLLLGGTLTAAAGTYVARVTRVTDETITVREGENRGLKVRDQDGRRQGSSNIGTYKIGPFTEITLDGIRATKADIKRGMIVSITQGMDPTVAARIRLTTAPDKAKPAPKDEDAPRSLGKGVASLRIRSISADRITVSQPGEKGKTYLITQDTAVYKDGVRVSASALSPGTEVAVIAGADPQKAARITAK